MLCPSSLVNSLTREFERGFKEYRCREIARVKQGERKRNDSVDSLGQHGSKEGRTLLRSEECGTH